MYKAVPCLLWISLWTGPGFTAQSLFNQQQTTWTLTNGWIRAEFQLTPEGYFQTLALSDARNGDQWTASPARPMTPVHFATDANIYDAARQYTMVSHSTQRTVPAG